MNILLANPRGFCAGVKRAISIVENAIKIYKKNIYVKHELVHNQYVIDQLKKKGVVFVEKISDIPDYGIVVFSAHGVSQKIIEESKKKKLIILNATCPLVTKIHKKVLNYSKSGIDTILIGHAGHPEVNGIIGQYTSKTGKIHLIESLEDIKKLSINKNQKLHYVTQTTLSIKKTKMIISALKKKFSNISASNTSDICYATTNRQKAMYHLSKKSDIILILGSKSSSNSNRLVELGNSLGVFTKLISSFHEINIQWLKNVNLIGITASASAPEILVQEVIKYLKKFGIKKITELEGIQEKNVFKIPKKLFNQELGDKNE